MASDNELQDALSEIQATIVRKLAPWLVALVAGGTFVGGSGVFRVDKFGQTDANAMKEHILEEIDHRFELLRAKEMPPTGTRLRIWELEQWAEDQDPAYQRPTQEW